MPFTAILLKNLPHLPTFASFHAERIASRCININAVALRVIFCKYCSHRILSPYRPINHSLQKLESFQSVHHVTFILCYNVLSELFPLSEFVKTDGTI